MKFPSTADLTATGFGLTFACAPGGGPRDSGTGVQDIPSDAPV